MRALVLYFPQRSLTTSDPIPPETPDTPFWKQPAWQADWERFLKIRL